MQYVVKSGDSLSKIGASLGVSWSSIANANGIKPPYTIYPGQKIEVPTSGSSVGTAGPQPYNGQPISPIGGSNVSNAADFSNPLNMIINGVLLYGIFKVIMKVL
jgi:LysM repeat protein